MKNSVTSRKVRIEIVNAIINEMANRSRKFFAGKYGIAIVFQKNSRLYMRNERNGYEMPLSTKNGYPPKKWCHGGTLWGLIKEFKSFIMTGEKSNQKNKYSGLYCPYWGYPQSDMLEIQAKAKSLGYL